MLHSAATPRRSLLLGLAGTLVAPAVLRAQGTAGSTIDGWPARPVRIVIPFTPGGSNDAVARPLAERLQARFGQPFVIENRPGAGGVIGADNVAKSAADGYSLMITSSSFTTSAAVQRTPYDADRDFDPIALVARAPMLLVAAPDFPARTLGDVIRLAKEKPGEVNYGSSGPGGINHLSTERLRQVTGINITHVPYRGIGPAATDLISNNIQILITSLASVAGLVREKRINLICYTDEGRPPNTPEAPTAKESGVDYSASLFWGFYGPRNLPPAIRNGLNQAANAALGDTRLTTYLASEGASAVPMSPDQFAGFVHEDLARWRDVAKRGNIHVE